MYNLARSLSSDLTNVAEGIDVSSFDINSIITIVIVVAMILVLFKVVNKIVKLLSSIAFITYVLIQAFGTEWITNLINLGK